MKTKLCSMKGCRGDGFGTQELCYEHYEAVKRLKDKAMRKARRLEREELEKKPVLQ